MHALQDLLSAVTFGTPVTHGPLTCLPLIEIEGAGRRTPAEEPMVLEEALASGRFTVTEVSEGGSVPTLRVLNETGKPVFLLDGEELVGAKQNRVLNLSLLVPAGASIEIPVSCVEAGRWSYHRRDFAAAERVQFARGRARKLEQVSASLASRGAAFSDQGDVWAEIDAKATRMAARSATGAMAAIYESRAGELQRFAAGIEPVPGQRGALYLIGEQVAGIDLFATPPLAAKLARKVLHGYALDALEQPNLPPAKDPELAARVFLMALQECGAQAFPAPGRGKTLRLGGEDAVGAALVAEGAVLHLEAFPNAT